MQGGGASAVARFEALAPAPPCTLGACYRRCRSSAARAGHFNTRNGGRAAIAERSEATGYGENRRKAARMARARAGSSTGRARSWFALMRKAAARARMERASGGGGVSARGSKAPRGTRLSQLWPLIRSGTVSLNFRRSSLMEQAERASRAAKRSVIFVRTGCLPLIIFRLQLQM